MELYILESNNQRLYALNAANGTMLWESQTTDAVKSSPTNL